MNVDVISTARLDLVPMTQRFLECTCERRRDEAEALLAMRIPPLWFESGKFAALRLRQLRDGETSLPWLPRAITFQDMKEMIGYIGFHTSPAPDYLKALSPNGVEFGYYVFAAFRRRGVALEASRGLMGWAAHKYGVSRFVVSVSPQNPASLALIAKLGFRKIGAHIDEEDGPEDIFELDFHEEAHLRPLEPTPGSATLRAGEGARK